MGWAGWLASWLELDLTVEEKAGLIYHFVVVVFSSVLVSCLYSGVVVKFFSSSSVHLLMVVGRAGCLYISFVFNSTYIKKCCKNKRQDASHLQ